MSHSDAANRDVLSYLQIEQLPSQKESTSVWIKDGYPLQTHPDLCERVQRIDATLDGLTEFRYLFGRPALLAVNAVIVAFATGTHIFCVRLRRQDCADGVVDERRDRPSRFPILRKKQRQLAALTSREWTRLDPWKDEVADHVAKAVRAAQEVAGANPNGSR